MNISIPLIMGIDTPISLLKESNSDYITRSDLTDYINLDEIQTIIGQKTFNKIVVNDDGEFLDNVVIGNTNTDLLDIKSTAKFYSTINGVDSSLISKLNVLSNVPDSTDLQFKLDYLESQSDFLTTNISSNLALVQTNAFSTAQLQNNNIALKLDKTEFDTYKSTTDTNILNLQNAIVNVDMTDKLDVSVFNTFQTTNTTNLNNKVDKSIHDAFVLYVDNFKASKSYVDNMDNQINTEILNLQTNKADISYILAQDEILSSNILALESGKLDLSIYTSDLSSLNTLINSKVDITQVNSAINSKYSLLLNGVSTNYDTLLEIETKLNQNDSSLNTLITNMNNSINLSSDNTFTGNNTFSGSNTFNDIILNNNSLNTTLSTINNNITSNTDNIALLETNKQDVILYDSVPTINSTKILNSGGIYSTLSLYNTKNEDASIYQTINGMTDYVLSSVLTSTLSNYVLSSSLSSYVSNSSLTSTLSNYVLSSSLSSYVSNSSLTTTLSNYVLSSSLSSYALTSSLSSYFNLSGSNTISGSNNYTELQRFNKIGENYNVVSFSSNNLTCNYANGAVFYATANATNALITIQNIPTSTNYVVYNLTLILDTSTNKTYCNTANINGSSVSVVFVGGSANIDISTSTLVYQTFQIIYSTSILKLVSSVIPIF